MAVNINPTSNIPNLQSGASAWIAWHKGMRKRYGKKTANIIFLEAWAKRSSSSANTKDLRNYLEKKGIKVERDILNYTADVFDDIGDFFSFGIGFGKITMIIVVAIILMGLAMIIFKIGKDPYKAAGTAVALRTGGAGTKALT